MGADFVVERSLRMAASPAAVMAELVDFHRWVAWSPWEGLDPDLRRTYSGPDSGEGAQYAWAGNRRAGAGDMVITGLSPDAVDIALRFTRPFPSSGALRFEVRQADGGAAVVWRMRSPRTLATRVMSVVMPLDKVVGPDFERGLQQLRSVVEA